MQSNSSILQEKSKAKKTKQSKNSKMESVQPLEKRRKSAIEVTILNPKVDLQKRANPRKTSAGQATPRGVREDDSARSQLSAHQRKNIDKRLPRLFSPFTSLFTSKQKGFGAKVLGTVDATHEEYKTISFISENDMLVIIGEGKNGQQKIEQLKKVPCMPYENENELAINGRVFIKNQDNSLGWIRISELNDKKSKKILRNFPPSGYLSYLVIKVNMNPKEDELPDVFYELRVAPTAHVKNLPQELKPEEAKKSAVPEELKEEQIETDEEIEIKKKIDPADCVVAGGEMYVHGNKIVSMVNDGTGHFWDAILRNVGDELAEPIILAFIDQCAHVENPYYKIIPGEEGKKPLQDTLGKHIKNADEMLYEITKGTPFKVR